MKERTSIAAALCSLILVGTASTAHGLTVNITNGLTPSVYLRVGNGVYTGTFNANGTPGNGGGRNLVSVTVPAAQLGNGTALAMTGNGTQPNSNYDGFAFCNVPAQIGPEYQRFRTA